VALMFEVVLAAGVLIVQLSRPSTIVPADRLAVRVIDDGAAGGPKALSTQVVPLS
jgi:hypothetical protein